ncbi:MAG: hypothetical protein U0704_13495 [Candidatus Eisenbacteria bacterium]
MSRVPPAARALRPLFVAALLGLAPGPVRAESGGPPELAPGRSVTRDAVATSRAARVEALRALARTQAAELDSLAAFAAAYPAEGARWQRTIEAAKQRHVREEIVLQREFALRFGHAALARRLALRLERLELAGGGAR